MPKKKTSPDKVNEKIRYISNLQLTNVIDSKFNKGWAKKYLDLVTQQEMALIKPDFDDTRYSPKIKNEK